SSRRRHTRFSRDWSSDVCSSDLRSAEIPLMDKLLGFILLLGIIFVFLVLAKKLVNTIRSMKDSLNIAHFFIFLTIACGGLSKVLDRTTSTLREEFNIQLIPHTQVDRKS